MLHAERQLERRPWTRLTKEPNGSLIFLKSTATDRKCTGSGGFKGGGLGPPCCCTSVGHILTFCVSLHLCKISNSILWSIFILKV